MRVNYVSYFILKNYFPKILLTVDRTGVKHKHCSAERKGLYFLSSSCSFLKEKEEKKKKADISPHSDKYLSLVKSVR